MDVRATLQQALRLHQGGSLPAAERLYRAVLQQEPFNASALHHLGLLARDAGHHKAAVDLMAQSVALDPGNLTFRVNQIGVLEAAGQRQPAEDAARKLAAEHPGDFRLQAGLALLLGRNGKASESVDVWERVVSLAPNDPAILFHSAAALEQTGNGTLARARYEAAVAIKPDFGEALQHLGVLALRRGDQDGALQFLQKSVDLLPSNVDARSALANVLVFHNRVDEALKHARIARDLAPDHPDILSTYGSILLTCGQVEEAVQAHTRAVALARNPVDYHSDLLLTRLYLDASGQEELAAHRLFNQHCAERFPAHPAPPRALADGEKLRVGYVSADFQVHPVGLFIAPLLAHHDRTRFEIHCFSNTTVKDELTEQIRASVDAFHDIEPRTTTFQQLDALVRSRQIDILIDLAGHTGANCLRLFAKKPAPVQMTYLGYPNTTGLETIDFRITDAVADPPGESDTFCTEKLLRLPHSFGLFAPPPNAPAVRPLPSLSNGHVTFGTLGRIEKWSAQTLKSWANILNAVPDARFRLIGTGYDDPTYGAHILARLAACGIEPARVDRIGRKPMAEYLAETSNIDLLLDTNPFNGHTTTLQALYMGVPTVTLAGKLHRSRMGASVLTALGMPELIAQSPQEYEQIAIALAQNFTRLAQIRNTLRDRLLSSSLCDAPGFARAFEALLLRAWNDRVGRDS